MISLSYSLPCLLQSWCELILLHYHLREHMMCAELCNWLRLQSYLCECLRLDVVFLHCQFRQMQGIWATSEAGRSRDQSLQNNLQS